MADKALKDVKVLEIANGIGAAYCTKLLADLGAEIIKIEPPGSGAKSRRRAPYIGNDPHPEKSCIFQYTNTNKLGITLDPSMAEGRKIFLKLAAEADVFVTDLPTQALEALHLTYDELQTNYPSLVMATITPFGESGPYRDHKAYPLNISHVSGTANLYPMPSKDLNREPVMLGGSCEEYDPGIVSAIAVMTALIYQRKSGAGQHIEVSEQESRISMQKLESVVYPVYGKNLSRKAEKLNIFPGGILPCKDGHVITMFLQEHEWQRMLGVMGNPEWSKAEWNKDFMSRIPHVPEINKHLCDWMKDKTKKEIVDQAQKAKSPIGPVNSPKDVVESDQFNSRNFFVETNHILAGDIKMPGAPCIMSRTPFSIDQAAPLLGQHNHQIFVDRLGYSDQEVARLKETKVI